MRYRPVARRRHQRGSVAVEFALVVVAFATLLTSIIGFGHWMYTLEMMADATRVGVRMAVVCDLNDSAVKSTIQSRVPQLELTNAQINLQYVPAGCTKATCQAVQVSVSGATYASMIPFFQDSLAVPPFAATLPRESMESTNAAGEINPVCS